LQLYPQSFEPRGRLFQFLVLNLGLALDDGFGTPSLPTGLPAGCSVGKRIFVSLSAVHISLAFCRILLATSQPPFRSFFHFFQVFFRLLAMVGSVQDTAASSISKPVFLTPQAPHYLNVGVCFFFPPPFPVPVPDGSPTKSLLFSFFPSSPHCRLFCFFRSAPPPVRMSLSVITFCNSFFFHQVIFLLPAPSPSRSEYCYAPLGRILI